MGGSQEDNLPGPGKLGPIAGKEGAAALLKAAACEEFLLDHIGSGSGCKNVK